MTRKLILALWLGLLLYHPRLVGAQGGPGDPQRPNPEASLPRLSVQTRVESRPDGVYVQISVRESVASQHRPSPDATRDDERTNSGAPVPTGNSGAAQPVSTGPRERYWSNQTGIYRETVDGHIIHLTPPPIGSAGLDGWRNDLNAHPNQTPYLLYVDDQYNGVVWIPQSPSSNNVHIEPMPPSRASRPSGNGDSTDAREVALDALGHVRLPDIHVQVNPSLGLVHLPGWFWVDGYDGRPFGVTRIVEVPPEVGDDVPIAIVPADDPRRLSTHFTVSVRLWPSRYTWDFGDGQTLETDSLGRPHPAESDIQHTYETSSLGFADGFPVRLSVTFDAEYQVNGGSPQRLPSITRVVEYGYRVQEIQAVLTGR